MTEPERPIPLEYNTPENVERVTAWMIIKRVLAGLCGMLALWLAFNGTFFAMIIFQGIIFPPSSIAGADLFVMFMWSAIALVGWFFAIRWLRFAFLGDRKPRNRQPESPN
ncbi:MAG TPA: hypothetical protein PK402_12115 [Tepidisphaeraceae bacterium]|nr:hypothetical protein [Tepidisphaeraceae bacterium]